MISRIIYRNASNYDGSEGSMFSTFYFTSRRFFCTSRLFYFTSRFFVFFYFSFFLFGQNTCSDRKGWL